MQQIIIGKPLSETAECGIQKTIRQRAMKDKVLALILDFCQKNGLEYRQLNAHSVYNRVVNTKTRRIVDWRASGTIRKADGMYGKFYKDNDLLDALKRLWLMIEKCAEEMVDCGTWNFQSQNYSTKN